MPGSYWSGSSSSASGRSGSAAASVAGVGFSKIWWTLASAWALIRDSERSIGE